MMEELLVEIQDFILINLHEELHEEIFELQHEHLQMVIEESFMQSDEEHDDEDECRHLQEMQYEQMLMEVTYIFLLVQGIEHEQDEEYIFKDDEHEYDELDEILNSKFEMLIHLENTYLEPQTQVSLEN